MVSDLLYQRWGDLSKLFCKGGVIHYLYHMLSGVGTAQLCGVKQKHVMILGLIPVVCIHPLWGPRV